MQSTSSMDDSTVKDESFEQLFQKYLHVTNKERHRKERRRYTTDSEFEDADGSSAPSPEDYKSVSRLADEEKQIQKVHEELFDINNKLQEENKKLRQWDDALGKREQHLDIVEKQLNEFAASLQDIIENEVSSRFEKLKQDLEKDNIKLQNENNKTKNAFKILKRSNDNLKIQVSKDAEKLKEYEEKQSRLKTRLANLQRKIEILNEQSKYSSTLATNSTRAFTNGKPKQQSQSAIVLFESFSTLLSWLSNSQLKSSVEMLLKSNMTSTLVASEHDVNVESINENCVKVIMSFATLLPQISTVEENQQISFLNFVYWSMLHLQLTQHSTRFNHATTYRRIGEELHNIQSRKEIQSDQQHSFVRSLNLQIRMTSSLILLHTVTQADVVTHVYKSIIEDLKNEYAKEIFLRLHGIYILLPNFKSPNKVIVGFVTDILMVMSTESPYLQRFLENLSTIEWLQSIMDVMNNFQEEAKLLEKMSILLQRLSKLRQNKSLLEALQVKKFIRNFLQRSNDDEFLRLNLRSILFNLDALKINT